MSLARVLIGSYQVIASATVFFKRFYAMNSLNSVDPLLLAPTCVFLSS